MSNRDLRWLNYALLTIFVGVVVMCVTNGLDDALILLVSAVLLIVTLYIFIPRN